MVITVTSVPHVESVTKLRKYFHTEARPGRLYYSDGLKRPTAQHCVLQYTLSGCGETWAQSSRSPVPPGWALINIVNRADSGYLHPPKETEPWRFLSFELIGGSVTELFTELIGRYGPAFDLSFAEKTIVGIGKSIEERSGLAAPDTERTAFPLPAGNEGSVLLSAKESAETASRLLALLLDSIGRREGQTGDVIQRVHAIIEEGVRGKDSIRFGVNETAARVGLSREYLSRLYHAGTGQTLKHDIDHCRIRYLCELLFVRGMTCEEAAAAVGIEYPANLTSYFKRCTGMTPTQYREDGMFF